jgi:hypothetical protein
MRSVLLAAVLCFSATALAQDAGVADSGIFDAGVFDAGAPAVAVVPTDPTMTTSIGDAGVEVVVTVPATTTPITIMLPDGGVVSSDNIPGMNVAFKNIYQGVKTGNWWLVLAAIVVLIVGLFRMYGKKLHEWIPDKSFADKPLWFVFETKPGAWILNWVTAIAVVVGTAMASGAPVDFNLWKTVVVVSTTGTALFQLVDDIVQWVQTKKAPPVDPAAPVPTTPVK